MTSFLVSPYFSMKMTKGNQTDIVKLHHNNHFVAKVAYLMNKVLIEF